MQTGLAGGDHLHFVVIVQGAFLDSVEWWDPHWIQDNIDLKLKKESKGGELKGQANFMSGQHSSDLPQKRIIPYSRGVKLIRRQVPAVEMLPGQSKPPEIGWTSPPQSWCRASMGRAGRPGSQRRSLRSDR